MKAKDTTSKKGQNRAFLIPIVWGCIGVMVVIGIYIISAPGKTLFNNLGPEENITSIPEKDDFDRIENGIHVRTGLIDAPGLMETVNNCTSCHSSKLVTQNRMSAERWKATIRWMQETQNLWDLGKNEAIIIDYLVENYPQKASGRREVLSEVEWYVLEQ